MIALSFPAGYNRTSGPMESLARELFTGLACTTLGNNQTHTKMAKETKKTTKADVKVKDLKPKKDPKGGVNLKGSSSAAKILK